MPNKLTIQPPPLLFFKSVQYGSITISDNDLTNTATINSVDTSKSLVFFLGFYASSFLLNFFFSRLELQDSTTIIATRNSGTPGVSSTINFCVIEFIDGIASVQQSTVSILSGSTQADKSILSVDISKSLLFFLGSTTDCILTFVNDIFPTITLLNSTTVRAIRRNTGFDTVTGFSVLEFS